jgi:hypothetical protein
VYVDIYLDPFIELNLLQPHSVFIGNGIYWQAAVISHSIFFLYKAWYCIESDRKKLLNPVERYVVESSKPTLLWAGEEKEAAKILGAPMSSSAGTPL